MTRQRTECRGNDSGNRSHPPEEIAAKPIALLQGRISFCPQRHSHHENPLGAEPAIDALQFNEAAPQPLAALPGQALARERLPAPPVTAPSGTGR